MLDLIGRVYAVAVISPLDPLTSAGSPRDFVIRIVNSFLYFAGALAVFYLIYGGVLYITAGGDAEKATKGRTAVINAIIGVVIILLALVILGWVKKAVTSGV